MAARFKEQAGKVGWLFLWLLGVPIPILVILFLIRGCPKPLQATGDPPGRPNRHRPALPVASSQ